MPRYRRSPAIERLRARRADGSPLVRVDLPYARALRGEIVGHGERVELTLSDGTVYRTVITSTPIVCDGSIVAGLSVWHDFSAWVRRHLWVDAGLPDGRSDRP